MPPDAGPQRGAVGPFLAQGADPEVLATGLCFPEGPAFAQDGALWCVELQGGALVSLSAEGHVERHPVGGEPNGLAFDGGGRVWFCDSGERAIRRLDLSTSRLEIVTHLGAGLPLDKPNDLAFDPAGTLVFTCPGESRTEPTGSVWALRQAGEPHLVANGLYFPNGLAFVDEGRSLVVAETYRHRLWKGKWDAVAVKWTASAPWAAIGGPIGPDGMALGADGLLYVAVFGQGCVKVVDWNGAIRAVYPTPGSRPTNCAFDPAGRLGLVVTEAERGELLSFPRLGLGARLFGEACS